MSVNKIADRYVRSLAEVQAHDLTEELTLDSQFHPRWAQLTAGIANDQGKPVRTLESIIADLESLQAELSGDGSQRVRALRSMIKGLTVRAQILGGAKMTLMEEFELIHGLSIGWQADQSVPDVHHQIAELIPASLKTGDLYEDFNTWVDRFRVWRLAEDEKLTIALYWRIVDELRQRCAGIWGEEILPPRDGLMLGIEYDTARSGSSKYRGDGKSRVDMTIHRLKPPTVPAWIHVGAHESCPGHTTEGWAKEQWALRNDLSEHLVMATYSPQVLLAEGIAETAELMVLPRLEDRRDLALSIYDWLDIGVDPAELLALLKAGDLFESIQFCRDNAIIMREGGATLEQTWAYAMEKLLIPKELVDRVTRFAEVNRSYTFVYLTAKAFYKNWLEGHGDLEAQLQAFLRLLREPLYPEMISS